MKQYNLKSFNNEEIMHTPRESTALVQCLTSTISETQYFRADKESKI